MQQPRLTVLDWVKIYTLLFAFWGVMYALEGLIPLIIGVSHFLLVAFTNVLYVKKHI